MKRLATLALVLSGCAAAPSHAVGPLRFHNAEPVALVNDRKPVELPKSFDAGLVEYYVDEDLAKPIQRALEVEEPRRAANVNSVGAVPDSAWFTNRQLSSEQIRRGPGGGGPDRSEPWHVTGVKVGGAAIGFAIQDAKHDKYLLKFDERSYPETESAADIIVQRLTWGFGYNVPDNEVVNFKRADLVLDEKAEIKYRTGKKRRMTAADLESYLGLIEHDGDNYRGYVSKLIDGKILGGVEPEGVRKDDPNDRVPHQLRRDLRGQRLLWAWVNHIDLKSQNSIAAYTDDKYIKWYAIDFGESLGVGRLTDNLPRLGYRTTYSVSGFFKSLFTFGLLVEPWERDFSVPKLRGLGVFESSQFDPAAWTPSHNWRPTDVADKLDELWAAEILMRFSPAHIQAAVEAGQYTDSRTRDYVVRTLIERQQKIGRHTFSRVAPLTAVEARSSGDGLEVCFDDLWLRYRFGTPTNTTYRARSFDYDGKPLATGDWKSAHDMRSCMQATPATGHDGYTIVELEARYDGHTRPPLFVHVARGASGPHVIGLDRR